MAWWRAGGVAGALVLVLGLGASACGREPSTAPPAPTAPAPQPAEAGVVATGEEEPTAGEAGTATVRRVIDGDTLTLSDGRTIRLAQVDAPETNQCFGSQSTAALRALAPEGDTVSLRRPETAPKQDRYGRTLAEVFVGDTSVDEALIRDGAAEWYEQYAHEDADLARRLQAAENDARAARRGLWSSCATGPASASPATSPPTTSAPTEAAAPECDPSYPDFCLPPSSPDLDCADIPYRDFRVVPPDPHGFDGNDDGVGCET